VTTSPDRPAGPLSGIRVFDLTIAAVGPWSTMLLAALGAEVIKIEPHEGELSRGIPPMVDGMSILYIHCNLGKKCAKFNLKKEREQEIVLKLASTCDVFVENMRPGKAAALGLSYEVVRELNPRVVYCSVNGYGGRGPMGKEAGADPQVQAFGGWCSVNGQPGGRWEMLRQYAHIDLTSGTTLTQAALVGLYAREQTGKGQRIEVTMLGATMALQASRLAEYFASGESPVPMGSASAVTAPHEAFRCEEGRYLALGVERESQWISLCAALDLESLVADPRFATNESRVINRRELVGILAEIFIRRPVDWWVILLSRFDVPAGPFVTNQFDIIRYHPQNILNNHVVQTPTPWGDVYAGGAPWKFDGVTLEYGPPPRPGEHTREVYESLGYEFDESELAPEIEWDFTKIKI
jgi:CoA:oxalate CoA-transferase